MTGTETPNRTIWYIHGLVKINYEKEGYSAIYSTSNGRTNPILKIPSGTPYGWKNLTAIYDDRVKEVYLGSLRRTRVYYGAKVWINCPCVVYDEEKGTVTLKADLFAHDRKVPVGFGRFFIGNIKVSKTRVYVVDGHAEQTIKVSDYPNLEITSGTKYTFKYAFNEKYQLSPDNGYGRIIINKTEKGKTKLTVEVIPTIMDDNEKQKLVARVYHTNHGDYIRSPEDIPQGGTITFYINSPPRKDDPYQREVSVKVGSAPIVESGFAMIEFNPSQFKIGGGAYNIKAVYTPSEELGGKYDETIGCGTLYVGDYPDKPVLTLTSNLCAKLGLDEKVLSFTSNKTINGDISLYMDWEPLQLLDSENHPVYSLSFTDTRNITIRFNLLGSVSDDYKHWLYGGKHNLILKYTTNDGFKYYEGDTGEHPLEYWYYLDYFNIQTPVRIELVGDLDNIYDTDNEGNNIFVGNNIFNIVTRNNKKTYELHIPIPSEREKSTTTGNNIPVRIINRENPDRIVQGGKIILSFATRTVEENKQTNIEDREHR